MSTDAKPVSAPADIKALASQWFEIATEYANAHRLEARRLQSRNWLVGTPSVLLSAIVGTSIFAGIQQAAHSETFKWLLAGASMAAAGLASLVTFYDLAQRATKHKIASEEYSELARRLQLLVASSAQNTLDGWTRALESVSQRLDAIGRRVELPPSMVVLRKEVHEIHEIKGMLPGGSSREVVYVSEPKVQREGFEDELRSIPRNSANNL
jgi:hypothetical protein